MKAKAPKTAPRKSASDRKTFCVIAEDRFNEAKLAIDKADAVLRLALGEMESDDSVAARSLYAVRDFIVTADKLLYVPLIHHEGEPVGEKTEGVQP